MLVVLQIYHRTAGRKRGIITRSFATYTKKGNPPARPPSGNSPGLG